MAPTYTETTVRAKDMAATQRYVDATGGRLLYAHFWSVAGIWTLVDPSVLSSTGAVRRLTFEKAMMANEMYLLGDGLLAVEPPLVFSMIMDREEVQVAERLGDGEETRQVMVSGVELLNVGRVITDPVERKLAWFLIRNGRWPQTEEYQFDNEGRLERVDYICSPEISDEEAARQIAAQGMAIVGALSTLNTRKFLVLQG